MAPDLGSVIGNIGSSTGGVVSTIVIIIIGVVIALIVIGGLFFFFWNKKRYNLIVPIKKIRSDGRLVSAEMAKGLYNSKRGVVYIKRNKIRGHFPMKVFDIRKYLLGDDWLEVMQLAPNEFVPILPESWSEHIVEYQDDKTGEVQQIKESVLNIKVDSGLNKAWKSAYENAAKKAYSLQSFINQFQVPISIAIVLISVFTGFALLWSKIGSCGH